MKIVITSLLYILTNLVLSQDIVIVNIGKLNRMDLGKQLEIINKCSPKVIGVDYFLTRDSLSKDAILMKEINKINKKKNGVFIAALFNYNENSNSWDSLKLTNSKFGNLTIGSANLIMEDSIVYPGIAIKENYRGKVIYPFSYEVAIRYTGVKEKYQNGKNEILKTVLTYDKKPYKIIECEDVLKKNFNPEDLKDKIVLLGYIGDDEDFLYIDSKKEKIINGIEIHAFFINELMK